MSARESRGKQKGKEAGRRAVAPPDDAPRAFYVYCVGEARALAPLVAGEPPPAIESAAGIELIEDGELGAVVSSVPLSDYDENALEVRLRDATWTATRAMRHEQVVEHFAERTSVVPLRFGTIYYERAGVVRMLAERQSELRAIVERLRGREEWGVNLYCDRARLKEKITSVSPRLRALEAQASEAAPGQSYLLRKKIDTMRADEARAEGKRLSAEIEGALGEASEGASRLRLLKPEATEHGELVAKLAFLVARSGFDHFRATAERLAAEHADAGFRLELTGPWPAYNFVAGA